MRYNLKVPFAEKDAAKALGARWDAGAKVWYVPDKLDPGPFAKWSPTPAGAGTASAAPSTASAARPKAKAAQSEGVLIVGSRYAPQPQVCECLPWEDCARCREPGLAR